MTTCRPRHMSAHKSFLLGWSRVADIRQQENELQQATQRRIIDDLRAAGTTARSPSLRKRGRSLDEPVQRRVGDGAQALRQPRFGSPLRSIEICRNRGIIHVTATHVPQPPPPPPTAPSLSGTSSTGIPSSASVNLSLRAHRSSERVSTLAIPGTPVGGFRPRAVVTNYRNHLAA